MGIPAGGQNAKSGTFAYDLQFLLRQDDSLIILQASNAKVIVSPKYQAKVFTSTNMGDSGKSFGWVHYKAFEGPTNPHMNAYGGENRLWLGPEGGKYSLFFPPGAKMEFANWETPAAFDTEPWTVTVHTDKSVTLQKSFQLTNYAGTSLQLSVNRTIRLLIDSADMETRMMGELWGHLGPDSVKMVAYETENILTNTGNFPWTETTGMPCLWVLDMFPPSPSTTIVIPYHGGEGSPATTDYFGIIPPDRVKMDGKVLYFKTDGHQRGKLGIHPTRALSAAGSYDSEHGVLTIIRFDIDSNARYLNQEWSTVKPSFSGDAVNAYNDGPLAAGTQMGPFYELESVSPAAFLDPGASQSHRHIVMHFTGPSAGLNRICRQFLGVSLATVEGVFAK